MRLSIVIPAFNEEKRIGATLSQYLAVFDEKSNEFIIVLNGCQDNTLSVAQSFANRHPQNIKIIDIPEKIGKGGAVHIGFKEARGDLIGFIDADGATSPEEFEKLLKCINSYDGVIASRWKKGSQVINRSFVRKLVSLSFIFFVKLLFWMPFTDTQCGAKIFKRQAIKTILPKLSVKNMSFDVELLYIAHRVGFHIREVPTKWTDQSSSALLGSPLNVLRTSIKMFISLLAIRCKFI